jgi:hypothetical protein
LRISSGSLNSAFCRVSTPITATMVPGIRLAASSATHPAIEWPTRITPARPSAVHALRPLPDSLCPAWSMATTR